MVRPGPKLKKCSVRSLSACEAAWLGALVDGEGHIAKRGQLIVANTEFELIATAYRITGVGSVQWVAGQSGHRPQLRWVVSRQNDLTAICTAIQAYCLKAQAYLATQPERSDETSSLYNSRWKKRR